MAVETIFFLDDKMHAWNASVFIDSASSTAAGYSIEAVRDTTFSSGWKPNDGTSDEYVMVDGAAAGWLGTSGTVYVAVAYDARGADQGALALTVSSADTPVGTFSTVVANFGPLSPSYPSVEWTSFTVPGSGKRYYRLYQPNANRGGGTKTAIIHSWAMFKATGILNVDAGYAGGNVSPHKTDLIDEVRRIDVPGGFIHAQAVSRVRNDLEVHIRRASKALWTDLVDRIHLAGAGARAFYLQYEGLRNPVQANFGMVRLAGMRWMSQRPLPDTFEVSIPVTAEPRS